MPKRTPRTMNTGGVSDDVLKQLQSLGMQYWSVRLVGEFLKSENMEDFLPPFLSAQVDGAELRRLGLADEVLRKLGLVATSQRMEFRKRVVKWTSKYRGKGSSTYSVANTTEQNYMGIIEMNEDDFDEISEAYSSASMFDASSVKQDSYDRTKLKQQLIALQSKFDELEMERDFLKEQNTKLKKLQFEYQSEVEDAQTKLETKDTKLRRLHRSQSKIFESNQDLNLRVSGLEAQLKNYMSAKEEAEAMSEELSVRLKGLEHRHKVVVAQNEHLRVQATVASQLKTQLSDALSEIERLRKEWEIAPNTIVTESDIFMKLKAEKDLMEAELKGFRVLKEKFQQTEYHTLYQENNDLKTENKELAQSNRVLHREIAKLHTENEHLLHERDDAEATVSEMKEKYMDAIKTAMKQEETIKFERRRSKMNLFAGVVDAPAAASIIQQNGGGALPDLQRSLTYDEEDTPSEIYSSDEDLSDAEHTAMGEKLMYLVEWAPVVV